MTKPEHYRIAATFEPWPEDPWPAWAAANKEELFESIQGKRAPPHRVVWGEGNPAGRIAIVLDNPGEREDPTGVSYVCGTRETLRHALASAGIPENEVYVTFLLKTRPTRKYDREIAVEMHLPVLRQQLAAKAWVCLVALGNTVCKAIFGSRADVKKLRGSRLDWLGFPLKVTYHPLAARRRPNLFPLLVEDLTEVAALLA